MYLYYPCEKYCLLSKNGLGNQQNQNNAKEYAIKSYILKIQSVERFGTSAFLSVYQNGRYIEYSF